MVDQDLEVPIPEELKRMLLDYTICYLLDEPTDTLEHAYSYFERLRDKKRRRTQILRDNEEKADYNLKNIKEDRATMVFDRRKSVYAEKYEPQEDNSIIQVTEKDPVVVQELINIFKGILIFESMDPKELETLSKVMEERIVSPGEVVIRQGDEGEHFFVIHDGNYEVTVTNKEGHTEVVHTYKGKGSFGELALLFNQARSATVTALTDGRLWMIDRNNFRRIALRGAFKKRELYVSFMENVPMLKALNNIERISLADALVTKYYQDSNKIISQGDLADGMYFIEEGCVIVTILHKLKGEVKIKDLGPGEYFGELALLTHRPRAATVYANGPCKLAFLHVEAFERILGPCMDIMRRNIEIYETQLNILFGSKHLVSDLRDN